MFNLLYEVLFSGIFTKVEEEWLGGVVHLHIPYRGEWCDSVCTVSICASVFSSLSLEVANHQ